MGGGGRGVRKRKRKGAQRQRDIKRGPTVFNIYIIYLFINIYVENILSVRGILPRG